MTRFKKQCSKCICHSSNWDKEVQEKMDEQAPGEDCSMGQYSMIEESCPLFMEIKEDKK